MVETVTIQKFKSKDGNVYDTIEKAERADKDWVAGLITLEEIQEDFNEYKQLLGR